MTDLPSIRSIHSAEGATILAETDYGFEYVRDNASGSTFLRRRRKEDGAAVLVIDALDRVLLVEAVRPSLGRTVLEAPRGGGGPGETAPETAVREVAEETGIRVGIEMLTDLGIIHADAGHLGFGTRLFAARLGGVIDHGRPQAGETASVVVMPIGELEERLARGQMNCAITATLLARWLFLEHPRGPVRRLEVIDAEGLVVDALLTKAPHRAFRAFCEGKICTGWGYRVV